jgi:hypothetical protein
VQAGDALAQAGSVIGPLGTLVSSLSAVLSVILIGITWWVRRQSREAKDARELKATNIAALRWYYQVSVLAATRGWDTDPAWPAIPKEMTPEFLTGRAEQSESSTLTQLAEMAESLRKEPR